MPTKKQIGVALSPRLIKEVDDRAEKDGESRTAFIEAALHRELERRGNPKAEARNE